VLTALTCPLERRVRLSAIARHANLGEELIPVPDVAFDRGLAETGPNTQCARRERTITRREASLAILLEHERVSGRVVSWPTRWNARIAVGIEP